VPNRGRHGDAAGESANALVRWFDGEPRGGLFDLRRPGGENRLEFICGCWGVLAPAV
jgi:hypothetical protein